MATIDASLSRCSLALVMPCRAAPTARQRATVGRVSGCLTDHCRVEPRCKRRGSFSTCVGGMQVTEFRAGSPVRSRQFALPRPFTRHG